MVSEKSRPDIDIFAAVLHGLVAAYLLGTAVYSLVLGLMLQDHGQIITGEVVDARKGVRVVQLPSPVNRTVDVRAWKGDAEVGDSLAVRYDPGKPSRALDARIGIPWQLVIYPAPLGLGAAVGFWYFWTRRGRERRRFDRAKSAGREP